MVEIGRYVALNQLCICNLFNRANFVLFASDADFFV